MRMSDFVVRDAIQPEVSASNKEGVIRELVECLRNAGQFKTTDTEDVVRAVLKREQIASTGIGRGVAIPHAKHTGVDRLVGTVGLSSGGVKFESLDGEPVHIFVLLVSPQDRPGDHLRALENISRRLRDDDFCRKLKQCRTRDEIWRVIEQGDNESP
jgi:PTS system fructose-specific IIA component/PTS system nitrogen regulatory IIA component